MILEHVYEKKRLSVRITENLTPKGLMNELFAAKNGLTRDTGPSMSYAMELYTNDKTEYDLVVGIFSLNPPNDIEKKYYAMIPGIGRLLLHPFGKKIEPTFESIARLWNQNQKNHYQWVLDMLDHDETYTYHEFGEKFSYAKGFMLPKETLFDFGKRQDISIVTTTQNQGKVRKRFERVVNAINYCRGMFLKEIKITVYLRSWQHVDDLMNVLRSMQPCFETTEKVNHGQMDYSKFAPSKDVVDKTVQQCNEPGCTQTAVLGRLFCETHIE